LFRQEFETLEQNGITGVALPRIGDPNVIPLWFGEGDLVTPAFIREAAKQAIDDGLTFYNHPSGRAELLAAIKAYLDRIYDLDLDPDRVVVPGSTMLGIFMAARMCAGAGDHALIVSPNWPNIDRAFQMTGAAFDFVRQRLESDGWTLRLEDVFAAAKPNTRALFINTPCNPTGWVMPASEQRRLLDFCRERGIVILADEVYHRNIFDSDVAPSFLQIAAPDDPLIVVNGFSKAFAMTGWRLGWMVVPEDLARAVERLTQNLFISPPALSQRAALAAFDCRDELEANVARYARNRSIVQQAFPAAGFGALAPCDGAFYAYADVSGLTDDSEAFCQRMLAECGVAATPGIDFDIERGRAFVRFSYAGSTEEVEGACAALERWLR
jgi:aspartate/methionine/tyrosine aminotransferase